MSSARSSAGSSASTGTRSPGAVADLRAALDPVRPVGVDTWASAIALARQHRFSFHDSLILASALEAGCDTLLTEDLQAGRRIDGLAIVNPFDR